MLLLPSKETEPVRLSGALRRAEQLREFTRAFLLFARTPCHHPPLGGRGCAEPQQLADAAFLFPGLGQLGQAHGRSLDTGDLSSEVLKMALDKHLRILRVGLHGQTVTVPFLLCGLLVQDLLPPPPPGRSLLRSPIV